MWKLSLRELVVQAFAADKWWGPRVMLLAAWHPAFMNLDLLFSCM